MYIIFQGSKVTWVVGFVGSKVSVFSSGNPLSCHHKNWKKDVAYLYTSTYCKFIVCLWRRKGFIKRTGDKRVQVCNQRRRSYLWRRAWMWRHKVQNPLRSRVRGERRWWKIMVNHFINYNLSLSIYLSPRSSPVLCFTFSHFTCSSIVTQRTRVLCWWKNLASWCTAGWNEENYIPNLISYSDFVAL